MESDEHTQNESPDTHVVDTQHEAHPHAHKRLYIGVGAIVVIAIIAFVVWPKWGDTIKEKCFGDGEVCQVPLPE